MGKACGACGEEGKFIQGFCQETWKKESLRSPGRGWWGDDDIKVDFQEIELDGLYWVYQLQNVDQCRDFVNTVMNLRVSYVWRIYLLSKALLNSQKGLRCSVSQLVDAFP